MVCASVKGETERAAAAKVTLTFEKQRITSIKCSVCIKRKVVWCCHAVAVILKRIRNPDKVPSGLKKKICVSGNTLFKIWVGRGFFLGGGMQIVNLDSPSGHK